MRVSIVTPTLNEARALPSRYEDLKVQTEPWEWIVVDGGSDDGTEEIARILGARVLRSVRGRGTQLNAGAAAASGEIVLFLHADTALPAGALDEIRRVMSDPAIVGGNFTFRFDAPGIAAKFLGLIYAMQQRFLGVWFGDSGIFCRRSTFGRLGGFPEVPILEDLGFIDRLRVAGRTIKLGLPVTASSRRYRGRLVPTTVRWTMLLALYRLGVSPHRLARWYPPPREHGPSH